jgi:putative endonuclease
VTRHDGRAELGARGETLVAAHLEQQGFTIVARNVRVGRLELDLIARRGQMLVVCEVRTRSSRDFLDPIVTIDRAKVERIRRAARSWIFGQRVPHGEIRFDAASVVLNELGSEIAYYEAAF